MKDLLRPKKLNLPLRPLAAAMLLGLAGAASATDFALDAVADGVYVHHGVHAAYTNDGVVNGDIANLSLVIGQDCAAAIDTGGSVAVGQAFAAAVQEQTQTPLCYVILTHGHPDHILGNQAFVRDGVTFIGKESLAEQIEQQRAEYALAFADALGPEGAAAVIAPGQEVGDRLTLDLGGRTLELQAWPQAHTDTDLTVFDHQTGTFFAGDLLFAERIPVLAGSLTGWLAVLDAFDAMTPTPARVVPGHGQVSQDMAAAVAAQRDYLQSLHDATCAWVGEGGDLNAAAQQMQVPGRQDWQLWDDVHPLNVRAAYVELEAACF